MPTSEEAAATAAASLFADDEVTLVETPEPSSEEETSDMSDGETIEFPNFDVALPEGLEDELTFDFEEDTTPDEEEEEGDWDDQTAALRKELKKAQKEAEFYRQQRLKSDQKNWVAEAKQYFPLAEPFLSDMDAPSKRAFLRRAKDIHERMKPLVEERVLKPARAALEAERANIRAEERARAAEAWGQPVETGGSPAPAEQQELQDRLTKARKKGDLVGAIRAMANLGGGND